MNFEHWELIYYIAFIVIMFFMLYKTYEKKSTSWIKQYFFKKPTRTYFFKNLFFYIGICLFALASLDLRGPEESVKIEMRSQKTAILIDVSASMAVEDIRPNRFEKALMVAMHFVKKSAGHKIAVFIFSNETKQVVPFTDDIDHINARIEALDQYRTLSGTSNLSLAINEVSKFFVEEGSDGGNILVFTDGEEHSSAMEIDLEKNISLGVVGIGTGKGGKIPIRDNFNVLRGYKKHNGEEVISKLNEDFLKNSFKSVDHFRYWIVGGYVIPTDEILAFFKNSFIKRKQEGVQRVRPVWGNFLLIPACLMIALSYLLGHFKLLNGITAAFLLIFISDFTYANEEEKSPLSKEESIELNELLSLHKKGKLSKNDEKYLASKFLKQKDYNKAATIYGDTIKFPEHEDANTLMNYGTSLIGGKRLSDGVDMLELALSKIPKEDKETREQIKQNILLALKQQEQQKKQDKENKKNKKDKDKKNKNKNKNKNKKDGEKKKDEKDKQGKDKEEDKKNKNPKKGDKDKDNEQDEQKKGKMKRKKMSALMKEILNDDKKLQKKLLDTSRGNKKGGSSEKDW